jgi:hypothetical protein
VTSTASLQIVDPLVAGYVLTHPRTPIGYARLVRSVTGVVFMVGAIVLGFIFLDISASKLTAGDWLGYFAMAVYGVGAAGCFVAGRHFLKRTAELAG